MFGSFFVVGAYIFASRLFRARLWRALFRKYTNAAGYLEIPKKLGLEGVAVSIVLITIALIVSRIIYRLFASQLHLWNDSSERVTMIQTYLALSVKGHAKEEHMGALIQRLFAPASEGVVKDDLGPIGPIDAIIKKSTS